MKLKKRGALVMVAAPLMTMGYIMFLASHNPQVRYAATFFIMSGSFPIGACECTGGFPS